uniref:DUF834 domain-containing protein n=1 Tax=Oryza brachyantha TaxID=4533 RepID=J3L8B5_ORYBR
MAWLKKGGCSDGGEEGCASADGLVERHGELDLPAEEKSGEVVAGSNCLETAAAAPAPSEIAEEDGGLDDILSKDVDAAKNHIAGHT